MSSSDRGGARALAHVRVVVAAAVSIALLACDTVPEAYGPSETATRAWEKEIATVEKARKSGQEVDSTTRSFFCLLAGYDVLATGGKSVVDELHEWFGRHNERLYWNPVLAQVELRECSETFSPDRQWALQLERLHQFAGWEPEGSCLGVQIHEVLDFFGRLWGQEVRHNFSVTMDVHSPTSETSEDVAELAAWYAENRSRLTCDEESGRVVLKDLGY